MARPEIVEADAAEFEMGVFTSFITSKARAAFVIVINMFFSHSHCPCWHSACIKKQDKQTRKCVSNVRININIKCQVSISMMNDECE